MFFFSVHPNVDDIGNHAFYAKGFHVQQFRKMEQLGQRCLNTMNSPVIWKCGIRNVKNFAWSQFAVIDVDDGPSLGEAMVQFQGYAHVMGTTKSHRKLKGNKIADRYRIFLPLVDKVSDPEQYKAINTALAERHGGDIQAVGGHMAFMPLKEIVSFSERGIKLPVADLVATQSKIVPAETRLNPTPSVDRRIPGYIQRWLTYGVSAGERNITCFKVACGLAKAGFHEDEIIMMVVRSAIPVDRSARVESEIRSTVRSALRRI